MIPVAESTCALLNSCHRHVKKTNKSSIADVMLDPLTEQPEFNLIRLTASGNKYSMPK